MKKIIVVEPGSSAIHVGNAIHSLGYEPVIFCSISEYSGDQKKYIVEYGYYEVDCSRAENIEKCILDHNIKNIFAIISTADRFIVPACQAAQLLGVKGMDTALLKLNNKADVYAYIPEDSPPTIVFNRHSIPFDRLKDLLKRSGSVVMKPASSAGAKGLFEVTTDKEIDGIVDIMRKEKQVDVLDKDWLAQPVMKGTLYSLEGFVVNGEVHYIGLSRRSRIKYTESQNYFPAEDDAEASIYLSLTKVLERLVKVSGYQRGYFHSEILLVDQKPYLIDANFGRVGGGSVALQIAKSVGKSVEEIYAHVIEVTVFPDKLIQKTFYLKEKTKTLSIFYGVDRASTFVEVLVKGELRGKHIQFADKGKRLNPAGIDNRSWVGILVGSPEEVLHDIKLISILTNLGVMDPIF